MYYYICPNIGGSNYKPVTSRSVNKQTQNTERK